MWGTALAALVVGTGMYALTHDAQAVEVAIVGMDDPYDTGRITWLQVEVANPGPRDLHPVFSVPANALANWYPWHIEDGPATLAPGERATYTISILPWTAPDIPDAFAVMVRDADTDAIQGRSEVTPPRLDSWRPAVINPAFTAWEESMIAPYKMPYGWQPHHSLQEGDGFDVSGDDGLLRMEITPRAAGSDEYASFLTVRQRAHFPDNLTIRFLGAPSTSSLGLAGVLLETTDAEHSIFVFHSAEDRLPRAVATYSAEVGDALGFADRARGLAAADSTRVFFTPDEITLDIEAIFNEAGWEIPAMKYLPKNLPTGVQDVGFGAWAVVLERYEVIRPLELKAFVFSVPGDDATPVTLELAYVGGSSLDPHEPWRLD